LLVATNALGWWIYPQYRREIKADLYQASTAWGLSFEVKEHLAWFVLLLAVAGATAMWAAAGRAGVELRQPIRLIYGIAAALTLAVGAIGVFLASVLSFGYAV